MATVIQSNQSYTGSKTLPNIIDFVVSTADKEKYLKNTLAAVGGDGGYITNVNADSVFAKLKAHRNRVLADGGIVLSLPMTLRGILFADKNDLSSTIYSAISPDFGVKLSGNIITKVYDLASRDQTVLSGAITRTTDSNLNVITTTTTAALIAVTAITGANGTILGSSSHDVDDDGLTKILTPALYKNGAGSGSPLAHIENNNGNLMRFTHLAGADVTVQLTANQEGVNYKKYSGIVGLSVAGLSDYLYENGEQKATQVTASKDLTSLALHHTTEIVSPNSFVSESWIINSQSQELAIALSNHLNKTALI